METTEQNQQESVDTLSITRLGITTELEHTRLQYETERDTLRREHEKETDNSRRQHELVMESRRIKLEMVRIASETLLDNAKSKPTSEREVTAENIKTLANELSQYIME
jgi:hypothetical protein